MKSIERYDIVKNEWKEVRMKLNYGRAFCSAISFSNRFIYIIGGTTDTECIEIFDSQYEEEFSGSTVKDYQKCELVLLQHNGEYIPWFKEILIPIDEEGLIIFCQELEEEVNENSAIEDEEYEENYKDFDNIAQFGNNVKQVSQRMTNIEEDKLVQILARENKLVHIVKDIKKIDKDNNGYVLANELNKAFKTYYLSELEGKSLNKILKPFSSIQNKYLIDYKKFNLHLLHLLKQKQFSSPPPFEDSSPQRQHLLPVSLRETIENPISPNSGKRIESISNDIMMQAYSTFN